LLGLRFEHADDAVAVEPPKDDRPVSLRVLGSDGKAVEGATVTIDAERSNWARSASTDKDGLVTITPLANGSSTHMAWVSKPGFLATQEVIQSGAARSKIDLRPTVRCSGIVEDEQGKPVAGAGVSATWRILGSTITLEYVDQVAGAGVSATRRIPSSPRREAHVLTNAQGRWEMLIPADLPPKALAIVVAHSDFLYAWADDLGGNDTVPAMSQLLDGTAKFILKRGAEVSGSVFKPDGTPGEGALVRVRAGDNAFPPPPSACADSQGRFRLSRVIPEDLALSVELPGCASETKSVPASEIHQPVEFYLKLGKPERMRNWVEKTFDQDHPDITSRYSLEWGDVKVLGNGNLSIRYKYLAIFRDGSGMVIEQVFTFSPTGKFVSVKDISKTPATQPALKDRSAEDSIEPLATQPAKAGRNAAARQVSDEDRRVREVMNQMMDGTINFKDVPLIDVLEHLRSTTGVNIWTNWKCLEAAGYTKESTIVSSVHLANVTYEKALRIILEDVSGPNVSSARAIGYIIDGGVITISIMETLPSKADATDQNIQPPNTDQFPPATSPATQPETTQPSESKLYRDVYILGSVRRPGVYSLRRDHQPPLTLRNLLAATGVQTETKGLSAQVLRATPEGVNQRFAVDVDGLFAGAVADPPMQENDLVLVQPADRWNPTVRKNPTSTDVMITGEVERPGVYSVDNAKVTLSRMLAGAGFDLTKVQQTRITILRCKDGNEQTPISMELSGVLSGTVPDFEIVPGDVIAVTFAPLPTTRQGSPATQPAESAR
jgi:protein involved in polysaccharide export with SLBB domain